MTDQWSGHERRNDPGDGERIAVLEANMESLVSGQKKIMERLDALSDDLARYRGFAAGVVWVIGGIGVAMTAVWHFLKDHLK
jgi:hypothetical protein